jgi:acetyl esterase/lipase
MPSTLRIVRDALARPERHRYGHEHRVQRAELWLPPGEGPHPVVIVIHGGYWRAKYGKAVMRPVCGDLVRRGLAAWNIEYRRLGRGQGGGWPQTFDDVAAAIDLLADVSRDRLDLESVSVFGHSAGGQLALWAASRRESQVPVSLVVAAAAVCDMRSAGSVTRELLGGSPDDVPERWAAVDPMQLVPLGVPIRLVHGAEDATVPVKRSRRFLEAARAAGDDVELIEPVPGNHRAHVDPRTPAWEACAEFLERRSRVGGAAGVVGGSVTE